jgi:hypothetical protein
MPKMDTRQWRRAGFIPAGDAARALGVPLMGLHRQLNKGRITFATQGRYKFVSVASLIVYIREMYTDDEIARRLVEAVREAAKIRNDAGAERAREAR